METDALNKRQIDSLKKIIARVEKLRQETKSFTVNAIRKEIVMYARHLAHASGAGYWLEVAEVTKDKNGAFEWEKAFWYSKKEHAAHAMDAHYLRNKGKFVYRLVREHTIIDARMSTNDQPLPDCID